MNDFLQSLRNGQSEKQRTPKTRKSYDNPYHHTSSPRFHPYGGNYTRNQQQPPMKRQPTSPPHPGGGNQLPMEETAMLADSIENLTSHIETLVKTHEYMAGVQERTSEILERQAIAIERIVNHLNMPPLPETEPVQEFENHYISSREEENYPEQGFSENPYEMEEDPVQEVIQPQPPVVPTPRKRKPAKQVLRRRKKAETKKILVQQPETTPKETKLMGREEIMEIINSMREQGATFDQVAKRLIELGQPTFSGRGEWHAQTVHRLCSKK
ncbi:hypothetical protein [Desulfospira joergensenii]|uniref:hypothetical protein n=1 Tax=Desulfospira joergensenii TaxID=53329 RepID=UPI0003B63FB4|nr:hypothetical protein [Desulfospira joergensenii]